MYRKLSRFNVALILCALILATILLSGCVASAPVAPPTIPFPTHIPVPTPTSPLPTITSVPIAAWVAQSVPEDTFIEARIYDFGRPPVPPAEHEEEWLEAMDSSFIAHTAITADGTVTRKGFSGSYKGQISQDELKQVVIKFAELGFFSISERDYGCVYYVTNPPKPSASPTRIHADDYKITITLHIHGEKRSIDHDRNRVCDERAYKALGELENIIFAIGRKTQKETPTAVTPTPTR